MDEKSVFSKFVDNIVDVVSTNLPNYAFAIFVLVAAFIVAKLAGALIQKLLDQTEADNKLGTWVAGDKEGAKPMRLDKWISRAVFWLVLLYGVVLFFDLVGLRTAIEPLNALLTKVASYLPLLGGAAVLALVAWIVAGAARFLVVKTLERTKLEERLKAADEDVPDATLGKSMGNAVYALVWLLFTVPILEALQLEGLLEPLQGMLNEVFGFLPNLLGAFVIAMVGWFIARVLRRIVSTFLVSAGLDKLGDRSGYSKVGKGTLSDLAGTVVYVVLLLAVLAMALQQLGLKAVSDPLGNVIETVTNQISNVFGAALILIIAWIGGKLLGGLVQDLLARIGFNRLFVILGLSKDPPAEGEDASWAPAGIVGRLVLLTVMLFAINASADAVGLDGVGTALDAFVLRAGDWLVAILFFGLGLWLSNVAARVIRERETPSSHTLAIVTRGAIIVLAAAMALEKLEVGEDVIQMAFGIPLAGLALGAALAFGLGGRDEAGRRLEQWNARRRGGGASDEEEAPATDE